MKLLLRGKHILKTIIEETQNKTCSEPLQLKVIFIPLLSKKTWAPFTMALNPKIFNKNHVKKVFIGVNKIESGINKIALKINNDEINNGLICIKKFLKEKKFVIKDINNKGNKQ